jgi:hypothetical protein
LGSHIEKNLEAQCREPPETVRLLPRNRHGQACRSRAKKGRPKATLVVFLVAALAGRATAEAVVVRRPIGVAQRLVTPLRTLLLRTLRPIPPFFTSPIAIPVTVPVTFAGTILIAVAISAGRRAATIIVAAPVIAITSIPVAVAVEAITVPVTVETVPVPVAIAVKAIPVPIPIEAIPVSVAIPARRRSATVVVPPSWRGRTPVGAVPIITAPAVAIAIEVAVAVVGAPVAVHIEGNRRNTEAAVIAGLDVNTV